MKMRKINSKQNATFRRQDQVPKRRAIFAIILHRSEMRWLDE